MKLTFDNSLSSLPFPSVSSYLLVPSLAFLLSDEEKLLEAEQPL